MTDQSQPNTNSSDEIDLGQLLKLIRKGFHNLGNFFLRVFIYLRRNILTFIGLIVLGVAASFGLNQIITKKLKTDVIVRPNFESKNYIYDVVEELASNVRAKNENYFLPLEISVEDLKGFKIEIEEIKDEELKSEDIVLNEMKYLEVLQNFKEESFVVDILRSELSEKSVVDHKITFTYKDATIGPDVVKKLMNYINTNEYYNGLKKVFNENAKLRLEKNSILIDQIDQLVENYTKGLVNSASNKEGSTIYLDGKDNLNMTLLLKLKNDLIEETEVKKLEIEQQTGVVSVINFGKTQIVKKSFFNQTYFLIPSLLVFCFVLLSFIKYLNRKANQIQ